MFNIACVQQIEYQLQSNSYCNDSELGRAKKSERAWRSKSEEREEVKAKECEEVKEKEREEVKEKERDEVKAKERDEEKEKEREEEKVEELNEENAKELDELGSSNASKGLRVCFECKQLTEHIAADCPQRLADGIAKAAAAEKIKIPKDIIKLAADNISVSERHNEKVITTLAGKPKIRNIQTITSTNKVFINRYVNIIECKFFHSILTEINASRQQWISGWSEWS